MSVESCKRSDSNYPDHRYLLLCPGETAYEVEGCNLPSLRERICGLDQSHWVVGSDQQAAVHGSPTDGVRYFLRRRREKAGDCFL